MNGPGIGDRRSEVVVPLVLFGVALALRLAHLLTARDAPFLSILYIDPLMYDEWALRIASGELFSEAPFFLDPFYPYFLGLIYAIFGHDYLAAVAVQSVLGALLPVLVYVPTRRWFDARTATVAGAIAAVYLPAVYFGGLIMKPGLALLIVAVWLWLVSLGLEKSRSWMLWATAGVVLAIGCLTRGNLLLVTPFLAVWVLLRDGWKRPERSRWIESGAMSAGLVAILILPALHNYRVGGELILTTANAGANFYIGNNPANETGEYQQLPFIRANPKYEQSDFKREAERRVGRELSDREASAFWFAESGRWLRGQPTLWFRLLWTKMRAFWGAYEIPDSLDYQLWREYAPVLRLPIPGFGLLAPLFLVGAVLAWKRRGWPQLLLLLVAVYCLSVVTFFVFSRFRMVVAPALYVFAAHGGIELFRRLRALARRDGGARAPALRAVALFLVCVVFVNVPVRARPESWGFRIASAVGLPAVAAPSVQGHYNLGVAYAGKAKEVADAAASARWLAEAERELRLAIELHGEQTDTARIHVELGKVLARLGRNLEAIEVYRAGALIEPNDVYIQNALGILYGRVQQPDRSAAAYEMALRLSPGDVRAAVGLGRALLSLNRLDDAERAFRRALDIAPGNAGARRGMSEVLERR